MRANTISIKLQLLKDFYRYYITYEPEEEWHSYGLCTAIYSYKYVYKRSFSEHDLINIIFEEIKEFTFSNIIQYDFRCIKDFYNTENGFFFRKNNKKARLRYLEYLIEKYENLNKKQG